MHYSTLAYMSWSRWGPFPNGRCYSLFGYCDMVKQVITPILYLIEEFHFLTDIAATLRNSLPKNRKKLPFPLHLLSFST
ncbi:hypothetical protein Lalb_Chr07g0182471 [Lupinus albus]|uniref:Uncharacterized protein n=1 Tax=Lupinus albus TaxID=3870 RepID=A0A6A4Q955_LUPAL|nr:hypothetical protein Lalb_Chr07g0182471 [Lupinus albus]